ncbi:MAG: efflux transporter outer membrane subunit [Steroidobacteraceae bacterium]
MNRPPILVPLLSSVLLAACAVGPDYKPPETEAAQRFDHLEPGAFSEEAAVAQFWTLFEDGTLARLVDDALAANHDLRIALNRVAEARALRGETRLDLAPTVTAGGGYSDQRLAEAQRTPGVPRDQELYDAGFDAFWELDFFGRIRRAVEASNAELDAAEASLRDAQVIVTAEVTRTYFELRGQQQQLDVARRNVENQRETLELTNLRLEAGRGTELDTSRAQAQLSGTLATIAPLEAAVARSIHRLGVLTGREPGALRGTLAPSKDLPVIPRMAAVGDPAGLLRRRPDIRVAERQLAAATARIGVAVADLFPRVTFTGAAGYVADAFDGLGDGGSDTYFIAPGISWAALDLGRVRAQIAGARARNEGALLRYEQTVLRALEETENALVTHARTRQRLTHAEDAARASSRAAGLARLRFEGGTSDFLQVLDAERTQLEAEDRLAQTRTEAATSLIAVYKSLGGGWENAPMPRQSAVAGVPP